MGADKSASGFAAARLRDMLLRKPQVLAVTGFSSATLYREIGSGRFPKPVMITGTAVAWRLTDIERWMDGLKAAP